MNQIPDRDEFVLNIIDVQRRLSAYVYSLVLDEETTREVVQRTNVVLLEKRQQYEPGTQFSAWAMKVAYYEILAVRRDRGRERLLFDDEVLARLAEAGEQAVFASDDRLEALMACLASLPYRQRELVLRRYQAENSVKQLADQMRKTPAAISNLLYRTRAQLLECVRRKLGEVNS